MPADAAPTHLDLTQLGEPVYNGSVQRLFDLPPRASAVGAPAFDAEKVHVAAGATIARYPLQANASAETVPYFVLEGATIKAALPLSEDRLLLTLAGDGEAAVTLVFDRKARGYALVAEEDLGPLALRSDGAVWRYDNDKQAVRLLRIAD